MCAVQCASFALCSPLFYGLLLLCERQKEQEEYGFYVVRIHNDVHPAISMAVAGEFFEE